MQEKLENINKGHICEFIFKISTFVSLLQKITWTVQTIYQYDYQCSDI